MQNELYYWLALWRAHRVGPIFFKRILARFSNPKVIFSLSARQLADLGFSQIAIQQITSFDISVATDTVVDNLSLNSASLSLGVKQDLYWLQRSVHNHILTCQHANYPNLLNQIPDPPPVLFAQGEIDLLSQPQIALVGSRKASAMGIQLAREFATELVRQQLIVTSGLALGVDAAAHRGALLGKGKTIAVLGHGLDHIYPTANNKLAKDIMQQGVLVSEFPIGVMPHAKNFPRRNRIISGLSLGVLVVEATKRSGSLITAKLAADQGREVFALPGTLWKNQNKGCHQLIRDGAILVETVDHILDELPMTQITLEAASVTDAEPLLDELRVATTETEKPKLNRNNQNGVQVNADESLSLEEQQILHLLHESRVTSIDELVAQIASLPQNISILLSRLEIKGIVRAVPGGYVLLV